MRSSINAFMGSTSRKLKAFRTNCLGSVTQITAVAALPMMLAAGAAIDTVRINREQVAFSAAVDSAALAVAADDRASLAGLNDAQVTARLAELEEFAKKYMAENYTPQYGSDQEMDVNVEITGQYIELSAAHDFPTTIMSLTGIDKINLAAKSQIMKAMRPIELVLVMDTTGSMSSSGKLDGAKTAARNLLNTVYGGSAATVPESEYLRVALVPFAAGVRLNKNAYDFDLDWIDTTGANPLSKLHFNDTSWNNYTTWGKLKSNSTTYMSWNGCVEARMRGDEAANTDYNVNDVAPTSGVTRFPAYFAPDAPSFANLSVYGSYQNYSFNGTYIPESGTPSEIAGLSTAQKNDTSAAGILYRQQNQAKYLNRVITVESTTSSNVGPWRGCAKTPIVPLTYKRANVEAGITAMVAAGNTLIAEGVAWGWRVLSPTEPFSKVEASTSFPADTISTYNHPRWLKIMVIMTDGDNDISAGLDTLNGTTYTAYGRGKEPLANNRFGTTSNSNIMPALDDAMSAACTQAKAEGIELYVTSFGSGVSSATRAKLQACATDADNYQHASSSADLAAFFNHIGQDVLNKMIYVSK
ncbi:MAG: pilus assembly protein TadG-related protein [Aestuariivirga sp.]|nr:pilus assembly protein TadG-related protein [Aestuariivirga sp.]